MLVARRGHVRRVFASGPPKALPSVASIYQIGGQSAVEDPTLGQAIRPAWIKLDGPLDTVMVSYLTRSLEQARQEKDEPALPPDQQPGRHREPTAMTWPIKIAAIKDMKTVAYIDDRATGVAALLPLACRDIVFNRNSADGRRPPDDRRWRRTLSRPDRRDALEPGQESRDPGATEGTPRGRGASPWSIPTPR